MKDLWIASANEKKREELRALLAEAGLRVRPRLVSELAEVPAVAEDGDTFAENARLKARAVARAAGAWALGDDSGLCVDALGGRPGVRSARYGTEEGGSEEGGTEEGGAEKGGREALTDADRIALLLEEMEGVPEELRTARFVCCLCLADAGGRVLLEVEERCEGRILREPRGQAGFGYDPVFWHAGAGRTFAELAPEEKNRLSHRGRALARLAEAMRRMEGEEGR